MKNIRSFLEKLWIISFQKSLYPNIGVTLDIGNGLFIPVILKANKLSIDEISKNLTSLN